MLSIDFNDAIIKKMLVTHVDMSKYTTFKTGGFCDYAAFPNDADELCALVKSLNSQALPFIVLGNCSNVLISDNGVEEVVVFLGNLKKLSVEGEVLSACCGNLLSETANFALKNSLSGFECLSGIPGSVGGGVFMNAGAYGGEVKDVIKSVNAVDREGNIKKYEKEQLCLGYRKSIFSANGEIVLSARFQLKKADPKEIKHLMSELNAKRREKQPLEYPSAGSTFKRPEGYFAGKLVQDAGLKGFRIGGAMVSEKHSGFVINCGNATTSDILKVIAHVQEAVADKFGVKLETEIKYIGR